MRKLKSVESINGKKKLIVIPIAIYLIWILATYLLEGRINLLQEPDPLGRFTYIVIANIAIGTVIAIWLLNSRNAFLVIAVEFIVEVE